LEPTNTALWGHRCLLEFVFGHKFSRMAPTFSLCVAVHHLEIDSISRVMSAYLRRQMHCREIGLAPNPVALSKMIESAAANFRH